MKIETSQSNETLIVRAIGRFDNTGVQELVSQLTASCEGTARKLMLDFSELTELGSPGLRVLFLLSKKMKGARDRLLVIGMQPAVREVFDSAGFVALYQVADSAGEFLNQQ